MKNSRSIDMVKGPLVKNVFLFALPLMATNLLQMMFNAADTIVVGKFSGQVALAAVGATGSLIFLLVSLFNGLSVGANVVIARAIGSQDQTKISKSVNTSVLLALFSGIVLTIVGSFASKYFLSWMGTPDSIIDQSTLYMRVYFMGSIFMIMYNFGSAILRAKGDTKRPLWFLTISGIINVLLNLFFVIVFHWGVFGVALATVISQAIACILVLYTLIHDEDATHLEIKQLSMDQTVAKEILRIGIPAGIQGMAFAISNVVVQSSINSFDSSAIIAGNSAAVNIENFVYIGMGAFSSAAITFTSQNIGAKNLGQVKKIMGLTMLLDVASAVLVSGIIYLFGSFFLSLYTNDPEVVQAGMVRLFWVTLFLFLNGVLDIFANSMRGMGHSGIPTLLMLFGVCGFRLVWLWTAFPQYRSLQTIYLCFPLSWIITSVFEGLLWIYYYRRLMKS